MVRLLRILITAWTVGRMLIRRIIIAPMVLTLITVCGARLVLNDGAYRLTFRALGTLLIALLLVLVARHVGPMVSGRLLIALFC